MINYINTPHTLINTLLNDRKLSATVRCYIETLDCRLTQKGRLPERDVRFLAQVANGN